MSNTEDNSQDNSQQIKKLPCDHIFHKSCLRSWFQRQQTCPTCRTSILRFNNNNQQQHQPQNVNVNLPGGQNIPGAGGNVAPPSTPLTPAAENVNQQPRPSPFANARSVFNGNAPHFHQHQQRNLNADFSAATYSQFNQQLGSFLPPFGKHSIFFAFLNPEYCSVKPIK
jgi:hypothetical protein